MPVDTFQYQDPSTRNEPWVLSRWYDPNQVVIHKEVCKDLRTHHIVGIEFLYESYKKQLNGVILNEEEDMNCPLQASAFLNALVTCLLDDCMVLVICSDQNLVAWHYHLAIHAGLKVIILTADTKGEVIENISNLSNAAIILRQSELKIAQDLVDYDFTSLIVEDFDKICNKLVFKRLTGNFNIGITRRNFYENPDQKTQWTMLNWATPGCVGKLNDFYEMDNENFYNFRDNYRKWWLRLTWSFCDTFKKPSAEEAEEYNSILEDWAQKNEIPNLYQEKKTRKHKIEIVVDENMELQSGSSTNLTTNGSNPKRKKGKHKIEILSSDGISEIKKLKGTIASSRAKRIIKYESALNQDCEENGKDNRENLPTNSNNNNNNENKDNNSSNGHNPLEIKRSDNSPANEEVSENKNPNYVILPKLDETPILSSIRKNFEISPEPIITTPKYNPDEPSCSKFQPNEIFSALIENKDLVFDEPGPSCSYSSQKLSSKIGDSKANYYDDDDDEDDDDILQQANRILKCASQKTFSADLFEDDD